jgi:hypothetical protein
MAVLVEATSVIVRREAIDVGLDGGWAHFQDIVPNQTLCTDGELARVGFMTPSDTEGFVKRLECDGLTFHDGEKAIDLVIVDQDRGPKLRVDWLNVVRFDFDDGQTVVTACYLLDGSLASPSRTDWLSAPEGWAFEGSISQRRRVHRVDEHDEVVLIDHRDGVDVYRELATGREVYCGRTRPVSVDVAASKDWIETHTARWSPCATCAHTEGGSDVCKAFPGGIPASILNANLAEKTTDPRDTCGAYSPRDGD